MTYDAVFVIESLGEEDERTGTKLVHGTLTSAAERNGTLVELYEPRSARDLMAVLNTVARICTKYGRAPIIHFEAHGSSEGISVGGRRGELVPWQSLSPTLTQINISSRMNVLLVAAMCHGIHMADILRPMDRSPAFGMVAPPSSVQELDLLDAMRLFYHQLLNRSGEVDLALTALRSEGRGDFRFLSAELWMCQVFREAIKPDRNETHEQRVARLLEESYTDTIPIVTESMQRRARISDELGDEEAYFHRLRARFLMLDLFPENADRFAFTYTDCMRVAS